MSSGQKGVMLCERPGPSQMDTGPAPKPFLPSSGATCMEPLGLVPTHKTYPPSLAPKPVNINYKSIATVREMEEANRMVALAAEERRMAEASKTENVSAFGAQLRAAILAGDDVSFWRAAKHAEGIKQSVEGSKACAAATAAAIGSPTAAAAAAAATGGGNTADGTSKASMVSFVDDLFNEAALALDSAPALRADGTKDASTSGRDGGTAAVASTAQPAVASTPVGVTGCSRKGRGGSAGKPAWALTEEEVAKLEAAEEEELLKFADELDFESFMAALDDAELQESIKASSGEGGRGPAPGEEKAWRKNLVKAMNHVAMKRVVAARRAQRDGRGDDDGDDDGVSMAMGSDGGTTAISRATAASRLKSEAAAAKRSALSEAKADSGGGGWDASTRASDDVARMERAKAATVEAYEFLRENPELRSVHSPASVRSMIAKADMAVGDPTGKMAS